MTPFWYIIANPAAGNRKVERQWHGIERRLQELRISYTVKFTSGPGHATRLIDDAVLNGHRYILGIGGDGTNHEMVNGILLQQHVPPSEIHYALLPMGTGNDWARTYSIPTDIYTRLSRLQQPQTVLQDVGKVDFTDRDGHPASRFFTNVAGMAYDGYVARRLELGKKGSNKITYLLAVAQYLLEYTPDKAVIEFDNHPPVTDDFYTINVGICRFSGGGMQFVPHAVPDDGLLALTFARSMPRWEVMLQTPKFYNGSLLSHPRLTGVQVRQVKITPANTSDRVWLEADGEFLGYCPAAFSLLEKVLSVVL